MPRSWGALISRHRSTPSYVYSYTSRCIAGCSGTLSDDRHTPSILVVDLNFRPFSPPHSSSQAARPTAVQKTLREPSNPQTPQTPTSLSHFPRLLHGINLEEDVYPCLPHYGVGHPRGDKCHPGGIQRRSLCPVGL